MNFTFPQLSSTSLLPALPSTTTLVSPLKLCKKPSPKNLPTRHHFSSVAQSCPALCDLMDYSMPGFPIHHQLPEWTQTRVLWVGDAIQPSHPLSSPSPTFNLFQHQGLFQSVLHIMLPKYWSFSISPSDKQSGLISFRIDWFDFFAVQGTLKSLLQHHSSKASVLHCSAFFIVQLSHSYMTTGKTIALTRLTFVGKVMSLFFNMLSMFVIVFLPRSKRLFISWLQLPSAVISESKKIKSVTVSIVSPSIRHEVMGLDAMILVFWMLSFQPDIVTQKWHLPQTSSTSKTKTSQILSKFITKSWRSHTK